MQPPFTKQADPFLRWIVLLLVVGSLGSVIALALAAHSDQITGEGYAPAQPVPFSHEHHVGRLGLDCRYCHGGVETGAFAGVPATSVCMTCHSQLFTQEEMLEPVRQSLYQNKPIHWTRVHNLPDYVYFDHSIHLSKGVGCAECHGPVAKMPLMRKAHSMTMSWCLDCHRDPGPRLRDQELLFNTVDQPPRDPDRLMQEYHVNTEGLTSCTACHR
ncbi:MAG: cytochrome c3 family protein [Vulcanimicrobiota bacterium]